MLCATPITSLPLSKHKHILFIHWVSIENRLSMVTRRAVTTLARGLRSDVNLWRSHMTHRHLNTATLDRVHLWQIILPFRFPMRNNSQSLNNRTPTSGPEKKTRAVMWSDLLLPTWLCASRYPSEVWNCVIYLNDAPHLPLLHRCSCWSKEKKPKVKFPSFTSRRAYDCRATPYGFKFYTHTHTHTHGTRRHAI